MGNQWPALRPDRLYEGEDNRMQKSPANLRMNICTAEETYAFVRPWTHDVLAKLLYIFDEAETV